MFELTKILYQQLVEYAERIPFSEFPYKMRWLIGQELFTPYSRFNGDESLISSSDAGHAYINVIKEIDHVTNYTSSITSICMSEEIDEGPEYGEYLYYAGFLTPDVPFLYITPPFPMVSIPSRLILYDRRWQFEISTDEVDITVFPVNMRTRSVLLIPDEYQRQKEMTEILRYSERPRLDIM